MIDGNYMTTTYDDNDNEIPAIQTYGCSCCCRTVEATKENLESVIAYHHERIKHFQEALAKL